MKIVIASLAAFAVMIAMAYDYSAAFKAGKVEGCEKATVAALQQLGYEFTIKSPEKFEKYCERVTK